MRQKHYRAVFFIFIEFRPELSKKRGRGTVSPSFGNISRARKNQKIISIRIFNKDDYKNSSGPIKGNYVLRCVRQHHTGNKSHIHDILFEVVPIKVILAY